MARFIISLTRVERSHLQHILEVYEREGSYFGNKKQHDMRLERIKTKLAESHKEPYQK